MALSERLQIIIEAVSGPAGAAFNKLGADAQKTYGQITRGAKEAEVGSTAMGSAVKAAALVGGTALAVGLVKGIQSAVDHFIELGNQTRHLEELTGASAEKSSQFAAVMGFLGVSVESVSKGLGIFAANIANTPQKLAQYGIQIVKNAQGNVDFLGTLDNIRTKFQQTTDATQRDAIAKSLLGRSYQQLLPYLSLTNAQLDQFRRLASQSGQILSQADVDKARELKIQTQELKNQLDSLKLSAGRAGAGFLSDMLRGFDIFSKVNFKDIKNLDFSGTYKEENAQRDVARTLAETQVNAEEAATAQKNLDSAEKSVASSAQNLVAAQQSVAQAHQAVQKAAEGVTSAQQGLVKAHEGVHTAQQSLVGSQQALNDLLNRGAVDAKQVADAEKQLESATRGVQHAQQSLADAQDNLNKALAGASIDELTNAQLNLQQATLGVAQAQQAVNTAGAPSAGRNPLAEQQAQLSLAQAIQQQKEAQERLNTEQARGSAQDPAVISGQRGVRDAAQSLTDAIDAQKTAAVNLRTAQAGDPTFDTQVAKAKDAVAAAAIGVRDAQWAEQAAANGVRDAQQGVVDAKARDVDASYKVRDATYALSDAMQAANDQSLTQSQIVSDLIAKYPELQQVLANFQAQEYVGYYTGPLAQFGTAGGAATYGGGGRPGPQIPGHAGGGDVSAGAWSWVGEQGPELVRFGGSAHVFSNSASRQMGGPTINLNVGGSVISEGELLQKFYALLTKAGGRYSALRN